MKKTKHRIRHIMMLTGMSYQAAWRWYQHYGRVVNDLTSGQPQSTESWCQAVLRVLRSQPHTEVKDGNI